MALLQKSGPMTRHEMAEHLDWSIEKISTTINSMRRALPGQLLRIARYQHGVRVVAVFAAEAGEDVPRPPRNHKKRNAQKAKRYVDKHRATVNAKNRLRAAAAAGEPVLMNPWLQLAPPNMRPTMVRVHRQEQAAKA